MKLVYIRYNIKKETAVSFIFKNIKYLYKFLKLFNNSI